MTKINDLCYSRGDQEGGGYPLTNHEYAVLRGKTYQLEFRPRFEIIRKKFK